MKTDIVKRIEASLRLNVINGDVEERDIFADQVRELLQSYIELRNKLENKE